MSDTATKAKPPTSGELLAASYKELLGICQKLYDYGGDIGVGEAIERANRALALAAKSSR